MLNGSEFGHRYNRNALDVSGVDPYIKGLVTVTEIPKKDEERRFLWNSSKSSALGWWIDGLEVDRGDEVKIRGKGAERERRLDCQKRWLPVWT